MSYVQPNSTIQFMSNIPFDDTYENTMYFGSINEQESYFQSHALITINNLSYTRVNKNEIRVGTLDEKAIAAYFLANYMRFKNTSFENKWWYAFIDGVEYINNNTVSITFHIDVIQSFLGDLRFNQCFVERCHTPTDLPGEHTLPEGLESGPYKNIDAPCTQSNRTGMTPVNVFVYTPNIILASGLDSAGDYAPGFIMPGRSIDKLGTNLSFMGRTFSGVRFYHFPMSSEGVTQLNQQLATIAGDFSVGTKIDAVVGLFMGCSEFLPHFSDVEQEAPAILMNITALGTIDGYTPRNNKLLCYPYNFIEVSNNQGMTGEYKWEDFNILRSTQTFAIWGNNSTNMSLSCTPYLYKGSVAYNEDEMLVINGFPMCAWSYDSFKAWLAQNAGTIGATAGGLAAGWLSVLGAGYGGVGRMAGSFLGNNIGRGVATNQLGLPGNVSDIGNTGHAYNAVAPSTGLIGATLGAAGQFYDHMTKSPTVVGLQNTSLQFQQGLMTFSFYYKQIKAEYARIIDSFFDMYGYKVNQVMIPNINARPCYTYVKTIGCSLESTIPHDFEKQIEDIFDKGIRFWKTNASFGSYDSNVNDNRPL